MIVPANTAAPHLVLRSRPYSSRPLTWWAVFLYICYTAIMKKPFLSATAAALYIVVIVIIVQTVTFALKSQEGTLVIPMTMLSLFVLSAAVMGYLFLSEPLQLLLQNKKQEAIAFFGKVVGFFACFVIIFAFLILVLH